MLRKVVLFLVLFCFEFSTYAQGCSTCRAQIESSKKEDFSIGQGLNAGIIFLMIIPYIILFLLFRKKIVSFFKDFRSLQ